MIKRIILSISFLCLLFSTCLWTVGANEIVEGESYFFGSYEQNKQEKSKEAIEWIVLEVKEDRALLLCKNGIDYLAFNDEKGSTDWSACSLREWLNGSFLETSFSEKEQEAIKKAKISNNPTQGNDQWDTWRIPVTKDKIFLLSYKEVMQYLDSDKARKLKDTPYASEKGDVFRKVTNVAVKEVDWWTRSPGKTKSEICIIDSDGKCKSKKAKEEASIRPALWLDLGKDRDEFRYEKYNQALSFQKSGSFKDAADIYETLGDFEKSEEYALGCRYGQAVEAEKAKDYELAIQLYTDLNGYKDSDVHGRACRYEYALSFQDTGDYEKALELFAAAGQYEDSMQRLRDCCEQLGIPVYFFSAEAVDAGFDNGYAKSNQIKGNDQHFGWRLGRFFMSGFSRVSDGTSDNPVFVKNVGDEITLWFDLEQDINALNENKNLSVCSDTNGYDQYFGIKKTNFGKGTLIVRHTDYQNAKSDPVIYTDYLLAKGTSGADTKIVLSEEGDYEVALDYEMQDDDVRHFNQRFGNYKIRFKFSLRNGNCMVYPFDVVTRSELQNTAVTENGFYLDLARSRYLTIDVKRSVIVEGSNGSMIEDERFNRPAKDGDRYTDEGIYTISVSNQYTGESTVKTIFVGSDELLQEYIKNGFSEDRLR